MSKDITMTKDGGNYWRACFVHWAVVAVVVLPVFAIVILAMVNPFWFRSGMLNWVERTVTQIARWRDRLKYRVYLGCDPAVWHALKD